MDEKITLLAEKETSWKLIVESMDQKTEAAKTKIVLDVGGTRFATTKTTLLKHKVRRGWREDREVREKEIRK